MAVVKVPVRKPAAAPLKAPGKPAPRPAAPARSSNGLPPHLQKFSTAKAITQGDYFERDCAVLVTPARIVHEQSTDPQKRGAWFYVAELRVKEVLDQLSTDDVAVGDPKNGEQGKPTRIGETKTFYQGFDYPETAHGAIKGLLMPIITQFLRDLGEAGVDLDAVRDDLPNAVAGFEAKGFVGEDDFGSGDPDDPENGKELMASYSEDQPFKNTEFVVQITMKPAGVKSKRSGELFPKFKCMTVEDWNASMGQ